MNNFATIKHINTFRKVSYYSLCLNGDRESIYEKYFKTWITDPKYKGELTQMVAWQKKMGERYGALERFFRPEGKAHALPPPAKYLAGEVGDLRLYCMVVNPNLVFLFSGHVKTKAKAQDCPNVSSHFRDAGVFSQKLEEAFINKELETSPMIQLHHLVISDQFEIIF